MNRICLIGNYGQKTNGMDGQSAKVRVYLEAMKKEKINVDFIDTSLFLKHPFSTLIKIKKIINRCDRIVLITAKNGTRVLLPYINMINRKAKKPLVFPLIGTSVLHFIIDDLTAEQTYKYLVNNSFKEIFKTPKFSKQLKQITYVLPETELLTDVFSSFYSLNNCVTLTNFRLDYKHITTKSVKADYLKIVYLSRVVEVKGVFDLIESVKALNKNSRKIKLDIFGEKYLSEDNDNIFASLLDENIIYRGPIDNDRTIETISNYDVFLFPTRAPGEGTPGVIVESLLAGVPILTSDFPNAKFLLRNGYDSIFYKMFDKEDLKLKLEWCLANRDLLTSMRTNALESSKKYSYDYCREAFLRLVCGK